VDARVNLYPGQSYGLNSLGEASLQIGLAYYWLKNKWPNEEQTPQFITTKSKISAHIIFKDAVCL
jgi:hypothetical protein